MIALTPNFKDRLLDLLLEIPALDDPANRSFLLRHLPPGPVATIPRNPAKLADLDIIIKAADGMGQLMATGEWALVVVAQDALRFVRGTGQEKNMEALLAELQTRASPVTPEPIPKIVIGPDARLPVSFLERGVVASQAVAKVLVPRVIGGVRQQGSGSMGGGTGWMIAPGLLLTNYHVIEARDLKYERHATEPDFQAQAAITSAWFGYVDKEREHWEYACTGLVHFDQRLDYALLRLVPTPSSGSAHPLADWGYLAFVRSLPVLQKGYRLNIIQHAGDGPKQVAIRSNFYFDSVSTAEQPNRVRYLTDTEPGASGSPVFNDDWQVVALHHASVQVPESQYRGEVIKYNNQGIALHAILEHLPAAVGQEIKAAQGW